MCNSFKATVFFSAMILWLSASLVYSDQSLEKRYLSKIQYELTALQTFLLKAKYYAAAQSGYGFNYEKLALSIKQLILDIENYINQVPRMPINLRQMKIHKTKTVNCSSAQKPALSTNIKNSISAEK